MDPEKKSLNFIFPTKYVIPKSLKFSHWLSEKHLQNTTKKTKSFQGKPDIKTLNLAPASSNVHHSSPCKIVFKDRKNTAAKEKLHPTTEKFTSLKEQIAPPPEQWKTGVVWNGSQRWEGFFGKRYVLVHFFLFQIFGIVFF